MTSRSDCEPLPKPTLSPSFALARPGTFLRVGFFTAAVWCVPALRVPLVHSLINHFRKKKKKSFAKKETSRESLRADQICYGQLLSLAVQWGVAIEIERAIKKSARFC